MRVNLARPKTKKDQFGREQVDVNASLLEIEQAFSRLHETPGTGLPSAPPATAASPGAIGTVTWDATHLYVCIAANTWVRCLLATF